MRHCYRLAAGAFFSAILFLFSCSDGNYTDAIPAGSQAVMYVDVAATGSGCGAARLLSLLPKGGGDGCGINLGKRVYAFMTRDGSFGICAEVDDADRLKGSIEQESKNGGWTKPVERGGVCFSSAGGSWVAGFNDDVFLMTGPVAAASHSDARRRISRLLRRGKDGGFAGTEAFARLAAMTSSAGIVVNVSALPELVSDPVTIVLPREVSLSRVQIAASVELRDSCMVVNGELFSSDKDTDDALKASLQKFGKISGGYASRVSCNAGIALLANVKGTDFLPMLKNCKPIQPLLVGVNAIIDMDNILRSVGGNMLVEFNSLSISDMQMYVSAEVEHCEWLKDVPYWKRSCPKGGAIYDWKKNAYRYTAGSSELYFGLSGANEFFAGTTAGLAAAALDKSARPLAPSLQAEIAGSKLSWLFGLNAIRDAVFGESAAPALFDNALNGAGLVIFNIK